MSLDPFTAGFDLVKTGRKRGIFSKPRRIIRFARRAQKVAHAASLNLCVWQDHGGLTGAVYVTL